MNPNNPVHTEYGVVRDILAVPEIIRSFDKERMKATVGQIATKGRLLIAGEGSSRLFPAKNAISSAMRRGGGLSVYTEAGLQATEYDLSNWAVFGLSNSGRTAEVIALFNQLQQQGHKEHYSLTAFPDSQLEALAVTGYVLECGAENAVAATKSVIEQALFMQTVVEAADGVELLSQRTEELADDVQTALTTEIDSEIIQRIARAKTIYWAGRNDGVAEELTLKTNEIVRKPADFLEGTYGVHGIEEVMDADDVLVWVNPNEGSEEKFQSVLAEGVGLDIIAISSRSTRFPTITIPDAGDLSTYVQMAAGWNLLVEVGISLDVNIDSPVRARKVGNEFTGEVS